jgi:chromate transporter
MIETEATAGTASETDVARQAAALEPCTLRDLVLYFVRLGTFGFGGPIALAGYMQRDLVERRRWISEQDYKEGLALAQLAPGPLAAQLAIYIGWVRAGVLGATLVAVAFIAPSFLMVLLLSVLYVRFGGLSWMLGAFYGIGAAVIAIIARSSAKLAKLTLRHDRVLWSVAVLSAAVTAWTESEIFSLFIAAGLVNLAVRARPHRALGGVATAMIPWRGISVLAASSAAGAAAGDLGTIFWFFAKAGAVVFGSGLAIVPFLHGGVVQGYHWLTERQFLDAVAVSMITPGPVVITVAFIGYLVAGTRGATVAAAGVFLPVYLFVIVPAPYFRRFAANREVHAFVDGVTAAATGAIAGAALVLGRRALVDGGALAIGLVTFAVISKAKRLPEPIVIVAAGVVGLLAKGIWQ